MAFHEPFHWSALSVCSTLFWLAKKMATTKEELEESNAIGGGGGRGAATNQVAPSLSR